MSSLKFAIQSVALLLAATGSVVTQSAQTHSTHAIFKSTDRGRSWSRSDLGMPGHSRVNAFSTLGNTLFAGTESGIFLSRNEGASWQPSTNSASASSRIICFAALGQDVFAGTDGGGILVSSDQGATWTRLSGFPSAKARCLLAHDGGLYAGTESDGVFKSVDGGRRWARLAEGLPVQAQIFAMAVVKGELFAGLYSQGLHTWNRQEQRWRKVGPVTPLALASMGDTLVVGHNPGGIHWSDDSGATWSAAVAVSPAGFGPAPSDPSMELSSAAPVWELAADNDLVFAGASSGIYYSEDRGRTWSRARTGLPAESPGVSFLIRGNLILAGTTLRDDQGEPEEASNGELPSRIEPVLECRLGFQPDGSRGILAPCSGRQDATRTGRQDVRPTFSDNRVVVVRP